ncbi:MAG TPA: hypothetical protein DCZ40_10940 [Lachnospiraceae bacterium]|nr:hypothetical protein [Lachnospiraceae bacterium]
MEVSKLIREIEEYVTLYPLPKKQNNNGNLKDYIVGKNNLCLGAVYISKASNIKGMLDAVLGHCGEDILDELLNTYGEESEIGQYIRRKRALDYTKVSCELNAIERTLETHLKKARHGGNPFYEAICGHLDRLGYKSDADFYNSIGMSRQQFSRLRDANSTLSKKTVLWIIVGLKLDYVQACDLLRKSGYNFRKNDMRDVILTYIFRNTTYDLDTVNFVLAHFGIAPLC